MRFLKFSFIVFTLLSVLMSCSKGAKKEPSDNPKDTKSDQSSSTVIKKKYIYDKRDRLLKEEGKYMFIYDSNGNIVGMKRF